MWFEKVNHLGHTADYSDSNAIGSAVLVFQINASNVEIMFELAKTL